MLGRLRELFLSGYFGRCNMPLLLLVTGLLISGSALACVPIGR